jgi:hypothetical protein
MRLILALVIASLFAGCTALHQPGFPPAMELLPVDQRQDHLRARQLENRVVVVTFFYPACDHCPFWMRMVEDAVDNVRIRMGPDETGPMDLVSIHLMAGGPHVGPDPRDEARTYLGLHRLTQPAYWDRMRWLAERVPSSMIATYVFDRQGQIVYRRPDASHASISAARALEDAIMAAL